MRMLVGLLGASFVSAVAILGWSWFAFRGLETTVDTSAYTREQMTLVGQCYAYVDRLWDQGASMKDRQEELDFCVAEIGTWESRQPDE